MGFLRLALAVAVLLSHAGVRFWGLNSGVTAVIGFYLISGYVMAGLIQRHFDAPSRTLMFYADRGLRLFPQYLAYVLLGLAWQLATHARTPFLAREPTTIDLVNNLAVVPLNYFMFNGSDAYTLVPPAWSLGAEIQFYLLAPLMVLAPRVGLALAAGSLAVHAMAVSTAWNSDWFGYRLLVGVLWVFGLGMLLFHWRRSRPRWALVLAGLAPVLAGGVYLYARSRGWHVYPYNTEVLIGWGAGVPLLYALAGWRENRWSHWAGDVSYGVFLNHFLLIWGLFPAGVALRPLECAVLVLCSLTLSWCTQRLVEAPVLRLRRRWRVAEPGSAL